MKTLDNIKYFLLLFALGLAFSCETEFIPEINSAPPEIVVEGFIEGGDFSTTPYVILTRSIPFFSEININEIDGFFVRDAEVTVSTASQSVRLEEVCLNELTPDPVSYTHLTLPTILRV